MENLTPLPESGSKKTPKKTPKKPTESNADRQKRAEQMLAAQKDDQPKFKRRVKGEEDVWHDLFCLEVANPRKNISYQEGEENAIWERMPHKHFFHTVDSDGKKQIHATPALGHTHRVDVIGTDEDGKPIVEVGPAIVVMKKKEYKINTEKMDIHTHEASYRHSQQFKKRVYSEDFLKKQAELERDMVAASRLDGVK